MDARDTRITLERIGRTGGRPWRYRISWQEGGAEIVLLRVWGVAGSEHPRRRLRRYTTRAACQAALDRTVRGLLRRGYVLSRE